jgi:hypothetical protein
MTQLFILSWLLLAYQDTGTTGEIINANPSPQASSPVTVSDSHKELNRRVWTFSTSDIFHRSGWSAYDVTQEEFVRMVRNLHPYAVAYSEGKTSDWARIKIGDTLAVGGSGNGFNIPPSAPQMCCKVSGLKNFI